MNLAELITQFRSDADDAVLPYLFDGADVTRWLNEAQDEAAVRARLIYEDSNPDICRIAVTAGTATYGLRPSVTEIALAWFVATGGTKRQPLTLIDRIELDRIRPDWRERIEAPEFVIQDDTSIRLGCIPEADGTIQLECYRLPSAAMEDDDDAPEIHRAHHPHLVNWALSRAYGRPNTETHDAERGAKALAAFTAVFGLRPDADMRRSSWNNQPQHNKAVW